MQFGLAVCNLEMQYGCVIAHIYSQGHDEKMSRVWGLGFGVCSKLHSAPRRTILVGWFQAIKLVCVCVCARARACANVCIDMYIFNSNDLWLYVI